MKWWFSDFDGTLAHYDEQKNDAIISKQDLKFINKFIKDGNRFIVSTGRDRKDIAKQLTKYGIEFDYTITNNGALVHNKQGDIVMHTPLPLENRQQIIDLIDKWLGLCGIQILFGETRVMIGGFEKPKENSNFTYTYWFSKIKTRFDDLKEEILTNPLFDNVEFYLLPEDVEKMKADCRNLTGVKFLQTAHIIIEIMSLDTSKKAGIEFLKEKYKFSNNQIIRSGDGANDLLMLEAYPNSFGMAKGTKEVLEASKYIIDKVSDIEKYLDKI